MRGGESHSSTPAASAPVSGTGTEVIRSTTIDDATLRALCQMDVRSAAVSILTAERPLLDG